MLVPPGSLREYAAAAAHRECRARAFGAHVRQVPGWRRRTYRDAYLLSMLIAITSIKVQNNERKVKLAKAGAGSWMWKAPLLRRRRVSEADRWTAGPDRDWRRPMSGASRYRYLLAPLI